MITLSVLYAVHGLVIIAQLSRDVTGTLEVTVQLNNKNISTFSTPNKQTADLIYKTNYTDSDSDFS